MNRYEKSSFIKSFLLYFFTMELLIALLIIHSYREDVATLEQQLFLEMKNYRFTFEGNKFEIDFVSKDDPAALLELHKSPDALFALFPLHGNPLYNLKIYYPAELFAQQTRTILHEYLLGLLGLSLLLLAIAYGFARYTLHPLRRAVTLTDRFIKDIIHDLNTPVSAIMINLSMLPRDHPAALRIKKSAETIGMLYRNLQEYQGNLPAQRSTVSLDSLLSNRFLFFKTLYPDLSFELKLQHVNVTANPDALTRIIDNLLSNACKYNKKGGSVSVTLDDRTLSVQNSTATPIRAPEKLFDRFYKEGDRGMGIGLHIVKKLCDAENISIAVSQADGHVRFTLGHH